MSLLLKVMKRLKVTLETCSRERCREEKKKKRREKEKINVITFGGHERIIELQVYKRKVTGNLLERIKCHYFGGHEKIIELYFA